MKRPLVLGHRGSSAAAPENTIRAFELAMREGADGVELDVMRCATGEVAVFHDDDTERLCGTPGSLRRRSWSELRELRVRGEAIPTLDEALEAVGPGAIVNVELKGTPGWRARVQDDGLAEAVAAILHRHALGARAIVSSFDPILLARFRRFDRAVPTGFLFADDQALPLRRGWPARALGVVAVHPQATLVDERRMRQWRRRGLAVNVWTVDDPAEIEYLAQVGVDAVITNRPADAIRALAAAVGS